MPINFSQINGLADTLANDRFTVFFPALPGGDSTLLSLRNTDITLPPYEVAQILVKILGWSLAFAGRRVNTNSFTLGFYEDVNAAILQQLTAWQELAAGFVKAEARMKIDYAVDIELKVYDTTGRTCMVFRMNNCWPMRVNIPAWADDATQPAKVEVDMSVDSVDLIGVGDETANVIFAENTSNFQAPELRQMSRSELTALPFDLPIPAEVRMSIGTSLKLMNTFMALPIANKLRPAANAINGLSSLLGIRGLGF